MIIDNFTSCMLACMDRNLVAHGYCILAHDMQVCFMMSNVHYPIICEHLDKHVRKLVVRIILE